jgi:hypothetical protein
MEDYNKIPTEAVIEETINNLEDRGIEVLVVNTREEVLERVKELIKAGGEVINGSSTTLQEAGIVDYLKSGKHGWKNLHEEILKETDKAKQAEMRRKSITAEYFLSSVNAISKTGALIACDQSGSRVGAFLFGAKKLILVSGVNKITDSVEEGMKRVREYAYPLEDERAKKAYGTGSGTNKWAIIEKEKATGRITLILVKEKLGF